MDIAAFGKLIKDFRTQLGITQKQLAEGICTPGYIYRIEKGERTPSAELIEQISMRLGIDLVDYLSLSQYESPSFVKCIMTSIVNLRQKEEYEKLGELLDSIKNHEDFQLGEALQFYLWNRGVVEYESNSNYKKAKELFIKAMNVTRDFNLKKDMNLNFMTRTELKVINALIILLYQHEEKNLATTIAKKILDDDSVYFRRKNSDPIIPLLLNYSNMLSIEGNYHESLNYLIKARNFLIANDDLYTLSQIYYHIAMNHYYLSNLEKAKDFINTSRTLAIIKEEHSFKEFLDKMICKYDLN